jgi:hypothetical protein
MMTTSEITRIRLYSQQISKARVKDAAGVVAWLGAMQAQDYPGAKWSIGLRLPGVTDADVEKAIADRMIVRTWPMRGTLHFVAAADARWMLERMTPRVIAGMQKRQSALGLDDATLERCRETFATTLKGGRIVTREEMYEALEAVGISVAGQRGYHLLVRTAMEGLICFGPHSGKQPTFVLFAEWLPDAKRIDEEAALAELARRYFTSHGPATIQDMCWWSGLTAAEVKAGVEGAKANLVQAMVDGKTYWMASDARDQATSAASAPAIHLLPGFDEYLLGYRDRAAALGLDHAPIICPGGNGMFASTIVREGRVVGTWKRTVKKRSVSVHLTPFAPLNAAEKERASEAVQRYGEFLRLSASVEEA